MEGLAHLVAESLVRHGFETTFDHRRLQWSEWFRCQDSFRLVLAPCKPGLFALGEEVIAPGDGKRMLALFQISEADDLGMALGRLFLSRSPERQRLVNGRCFARYVVIEDPTQRRTACTALQRWMASSAEAVSGVPQATADTQANLYTNVAPDAPVRGAEQSSAGFVPEHDSQDGASTFPQDAENARPTSMLDSHSAGFVSGHDFSRATNPAISPSALAAASANSTDASEQPESSNKQAQIGLPSPIPSGF
jgi:hypothetical protein